MDVILMSGVGGFALYSGLTGHNASAAFELAVALFIGGLFVINTLPLDIDERKPSPTKEYQSIR